MNSPTNSELLALEADVQRQSEITADNVLALRRITYKYGDVRKPEADFIARLNRLSVEAAPEWGEFYVEALTDFFFWQRSADEALSDQDASLLIDWISQGDKIDNRNEAKLLVNILARAQSVPEHLQKFAMTALKNSVLKVRDIHFDNGVRQAAIVEEEDVQALRRALYGLGSEGGIAVSADEATLLFEINNKTATSQNAASWQDLFVKAVTIFLLHGGESPDDVDDAEAFWVESMIAEGRCCYRNEVALLDNLEAECGRLPARLVSLRNRLRAAQAAA